GELLITLASLCEAYPRLRLYRVDDLLASRNQTAEQILKQIVAKVEPEKWEDVGGPWSISTVSDNWVLVTADTVTHECLDDWLTEQRIGQKPPGAIQRQAK